MTATLLFSQIGVVTFNLLEINWAIAFILWSLHYHLKHSSYLLILSLYIYNKVSSFHDSVGCKKINLHRRQHVETHIYCLIVPSDNFGQKQATSRNVNILILKCKGLPYIPFKRININQVYISYLQFIFWICQHIYDLLLI